jgi:hypothetical protein
MKCNRPKAVFIAGDAVVKRESDVLQIACVAEFDGFRFPVTAIREATAIDERIEVLSGGKFVLIDGGHRIACDTKPMSIWFRDCSRNNDFKRAVEELPRVGAGVVVSCFPIRHFLPVVLNQEYLAAKKIRLPIKVPVLCTASSGRSS